jgi:hypothetical protein
MFHQENKASEILAEFYNETGDPGRAWKNNAKTLYTL